MFIKKTYCLNQCHHRRFLILHFVCLAYSFALLCYLKNWIESHLITSKRARLPVSTRLVEHSHYCEAYDLGCFEAIETGRFYSSTHVNMSVKKCLAKCSSRGQNYAGVRNAAECACASKLHGFAEIKYTDQSQCDVECRGGGGGERCGSKTAFSVYQLVTSCVNDSVIDDEFLESRLIGCFKPPSRKSCFKTAEKTADSADCFRVCQHHSFPLMAFSERECNCGLMDKTFNLGHQLKDCSSGSDAVTLYRTLAADSRCEVVRFLPPSSKRKTTVLTSFPGSGNTWARYLIEKASGYYTGSRYKDGHIYASGMLGEYTDGSTYTAVLKDHRFLQLLSYNQTILLVRNPFDALLAEFNRNRSKEHTGTATREAFETGFNQYVGAKMPNWRRYIDVALKSPNPIMIVFFEDLRQNPAYWTRKMVHFAFEPGLRPPDLDSRLYCLSQETKGHHKREKRKLDFQPFDEENRRKLDADIYEVSLQLKKAGVRMPKYQCPGLLDTKR